MEERPEPVASVPDPGAPAMPAPTSPDMTFLKEEVSRLTSENATVAAELFNLRATAEGLREELATSRKETEEKALRVGELTEENGKMAGGKTELVETLEHDLASSKETIRGMIREVSDLRLAAEHGGGEGKDSVPEFVLRDGMDKVGVSHVGLAGAALVHNLTGAVQHLQGLVSEAAGRIREVASGMSDARDQRVALAGEADSLDARAKVLPHGGE